VSWVHNDSLNFADVWNTVRAYQRLDGLSYISARDEKLSILFDHRKTQPTPRAVDYHLTAAADKFQRILHRLEIYFLSRSGNACG
jgi:hypothetical protein